MINNRQFVFTLFSIFALLCLLPVSAGARPGKRVTPYGVLDYSKSNKTYRARDVHPLLSELGPPRSDFSLDSSRRNDVKGSRGTRLEIPPNAFADTAGRPVSGRVQVTLTEVIDDFDFVSSGLRMDYVDKKGKRQFMESAGMFNVGATQGGRKLKLLKGKKIKVQFPNIAPGEKFFVYKMNPKGEWVKHGHNRETLVAQAPGGGGGGGTDPKNPANPTPFEPTPGELVRGGEDIRQVGVRIYAIDGMTWWNFDSPYPHVACLKGKINGPSKDLFKNYQAFSVGVNYNGSFKRWRSGNTFKVNAHRGKTAKVLIVAGKNYVGISRVVQVTKRKGFDKNPESKSNFCQDIGTISLRKVKKDILKDKDAFRRLLGLSKKIYNVEYKRYILEKRKELRPLNP